MDTNQKENVGAFVKLLATVAGLGLAFYLIGFTVVQSYFYGNHLEGFFVLSREFYESAGVRFLLELLRAPLWSPLVVGPYLLALILLIPRLSVEMITDIQAIPTQAIARFGVLLAILIVTYLYCLFYNNLIDTPLFIDALDRIVLDPTENDDQSAKFAFGFFALASPMVIAGGILLWRFRPYINNLAFIGYFYKSAAYLYAAFLAMLPIAFGFHVYDWRIVEIRDPAGVVNLLSEQEKELRSIRVWLIGEFGDRYVFVKRVGLAEYAVIAALDKEQVIQLTLVTGKTDYLKQALD